MTKKNTRGESQFVRIYGEFRYRWWLKPICWIFKHKKEWTNIYGIKYKQCSRCGKDFFTKKIIKREKEFVRKLSAEEIGEIYGVKFYSTKRVSSWL